ncbi:MAG TPA: hypothetical protein VMT46_18850 [Anaerolineaceae bacterium]|nr:hypothetical protein [Anaerolineaceae bacterium]
MKAVVIVLSIIAFIACLLIGLQAGSGSLKITDPTHFSSTPSPLPSSTQRTILIILTDDLQDSKPRLAGLWTVIYRLDTPRLMLVPLYPANNADELVSSFSLVDNRSLHPAFLKAVQNYHFAWNGYILIDQSGAEQFLGFLGGDAPKPALIMPWEQWDDALPSQTTLGKAICARLKKQSSQLDLKPVLEGLASAHFRSQISFNDLIQDWKTLTQDQGEFDCEFPSILPDK